MKASFLALMNGHNTARPCSLGKSGKMEIILQTNKEKCKATVEPTVTTKCRDLQLLAQTNIELGTGDQAHAHAWMMDPSLYPQGASVFV